MPVYEYECKECRNRVEVLQDIDEQGPKCCEKCGGELKRLMGAPGLIFKGSGFYINDYARRDRAGDRSAGSRKSEEREEEPKRSDTATGDTAEKPGECSQKENSDAAAGTGT